jgi:hypothetical protein
MHPVYRTNPKGRRLSQYYLYFLFEQLNTATNFTHASSQNSLSGSKYGNKRVKLSHPYKKKRTLLNQKQGSPNI